jgi:hypothetical protein
MSKVNVWIKGMVFACLTMSVIAFGCASNIEYPPLKQAPIVEEPHAPNKTIARLRECVEEYGGDLGGRGFAFHYDVKVDEKGRAVSVKSDVFNADFDGCTRAALRAMEVPPELLLTWISKPLARGDGPTNAARGSVGVVVVVVGVTIVLADIVIEAGGVTIVFMIAVAIAEDVVEAIRRRPPRNRCLDAAVGSEAMWEAFCRSLPYERRGGCWKATKESEEYKRNWCNEEFGTW